MSRARRILLVDHDEEMRRALSEQLAQDAGFEFAQASDAVGGLASVRALPPDLVIMDLELPDLDGRELIRRLRAEGYARPIMLLTARDSDADIIAGLESGADDYVVKPFRYLELLARIRVQMRRLGVEFDAEYELGRFVFQPRQKVLVDRRGAKLRLTAKETALLLCLHRAERRVVPREVILSQVWGYDARIDTNTLATHVWFLRRKIEEDPGRATLLVSEEGGYKLMT